MKRKFIKAGQKLGRLTAVSYLSKKVGKGRQGYWVCECECGNQATVMTSDLNSGHTKSCGCFRKEVTAALSAEVNATHNASKTVHYKIWVAIKTRCYNKNSPAFKYYGAKGISICERWKNSYENFIADMGKRPTSEHSIDRINTNGNYDPGNCQWSTSSAQMANRRIGKNNNSGYIGVGYRKQSGTWRALVMYKKKALFEKYYKTAKQAAIARNDFIIKNDLPHTLNKI